jgi:hypothetical protein
MSIQEKPSAADMQQAFARDVHVLGTLLTDYFFRSKSSRKELLERIAASLPVLPVGAEADLFEALKLQSEADEKLAEIIKFLQGEVGAKRDNAGGNSP